MTDPDCEAISLLLQAELDGEVGAGDAAAVAAHMRNCPACAALHAQLLDLSARIRSEATHYRAPEALRRRIALQIAAANPPPRRLGLARPAWFGAGFAVAASLALFLLLPQHPDLAQDVVAGHIRALQPGHLTDVLSSDQHTVKPWFNGRIDFAPPVIDLKEQGFPLIGGRLDFLDKRPVAALVYGSAKHVIDLYIWPAGTSVGSTPTEHTVSGYNTITWTQQGMQFWAVSDLEATGLRGFVSDLVALLH
jgi:anti-sigma factor RsiW